MNRLISGLKQNLVQFAFDQCVPSGTDLTFCFNYNEPKKLRLKSIQYYAGGSKSSSSNNFTSINNVQDAKKFKIDVSQSDAAATTTTTKLNDKLKYSKVTIRIGRNVSNRSFNNHNKHFIKQKQLSKFNSNLKKRIGRNQENLFTEPKKCPEVNRGQQETPLNVNLVQSTRICSSTQVVKLGESQFKTINTFNELQDNTRKGMKRQLSELNSFPLRNTVTVANICTLVNAPLVTNSAQLPGSTQQRKVQPSMGLKMISVKTAKSKETKLPQLVPQQQAKQRELVPFLDSIEKLVPVSSSTFIVNATKQHRGSTESVQSGSSSGSTESLTKVTETNISPVSINSSSRSKRKQVRSISVMNVSSIMSNQF